MALPLFKEKRLQPRRRLSGLMPGKLVHIADNRALNCKPVDLSTNGLGVILNEKLNPGTKVKLMAGSEEIMMTVAWRQPDFGKRDLFRYGLITVDPGNDLEDIFARSNCLK